MSPSVSRVTDKVDEERLAIARAYGLGLIPITTYMNQNYQHDREFSDYHEFAVGSVIHNKTKSAPATMKHRYLLEDIVYGMVPWYELGLKCGLAPPTIRSLIELASVISGIHCFEHGRTLKILPCGLSSSFSILYFRKSLNSEIIEDHCKSRTIKTKQFRVILNVLPGGRLHSRLHGPRGYLHSRLHGCLRGRLQGCDGHVSCPGCLTC